MAVSFLTRIRNICLGLPNARETADFGHTTFRVSERMFAVFEEYRGELTLAVQVGKPRQREILADSRFLRAPYLGQHGWVSLRLGNDESKTDWREVETLVRGSYSWVTSRKR